MKKHLSLLLALLMLAPAVVSCAETEDTASPDATPTVSGEQVAEDAVPEETEISRQNTANICGGYHCQELPEKTALRHRQDHTR